VSISDSAPDDSAPEEPKNGFRLTFCVTLRRDRRNERSEEPRPLQARRADGRKSRARGQIAESFAVDACAVACDELRKEPHPSRRVNARDNSPNEEPLLAAWRTYTSTCRWREAPFRAAREKFATAASWRLNRAAKTRHMAGAALASTHSKLESSRGGGSTTPIDTDIEFQDDAIR